jgi:hypothetical protein
VPSEFTEIDHGCSTRSRLDGPVEKSFFARGQTALSAGRFTTTPGFTCDDAEADSAFQDLWCGDGCVPKAFLLFVKTVFQPINNQEDTA